MPAEVVEVIARFGDTILDVRHLGDAGSYRIGSAPGVDLAVPGHTSFPIVDGRVVRFPVGVRAVERGATTELQLGLVTVHVTRMRLPRTPVPLARFDVRPCAFVFGSLLVHLFVWWLATSREPLERIAAVHQPHYRHVHVADPPPDPPVVEPEPKPESHDQQAALAAQPRASGRVAGKRAGTEHGDRLSTMADSARALARAVAEVDVEGKLAALDPDATFDEDAANARGFGGSRRFDPSAREGFEPIPSGHYQTLTIDVTTCPEQRCRLKGPIPPLWIRTHLHEHMSEIAACYAAHAGGPGEILLEFTITGDGAVKGARGSGLGETGACAAAVVGKIYFKALEAETTVRYPVRFNGRY